MTKLLVVQPDPIDSLDRFGGSLVEAGLDVRVIQPFAGETLPEELEEHGLLVLGGGMSAGDDDKYPWLGDVRNLLRQAVDRSCPVLGICLGGQLLAQTVGGSVSTGDRGLETGVVQVRWRPEAQTDALFADLPAPFLAGTFHFDMITTLPDTAVWLGESDIYPHQAFRVAPLAWGVQFHPEVSLAGYLTWVSEYAGADRLTVERLQRGAEDFRRLDDQVAAATALLARRFAELVRSSAQQRHSRAAT